MDHFMRVFYAGILGYGRSCTTAGVFPESVKRERSFDDSGVKKGMTR